MKGSINPQGASEFARTRAEVLERCRVAAAGHGLNAVRWLQGTDQNKSILANRLLKNPDFSLAD